MQLSKLTFSLASLVVIFAMLLAPTAVMAEDGGPTVTSIELAKGDDLGANTQARNTVYVKITFSENIVIDATPANSFGAEDVEWNLKDAEGKILTNAPSTTIAGPGPLPAATTVQSQTFIFNVDVTTDATVNSNARKIVVRIPADKVKAFDTGFGGAGKGNVASKIFELDLPPLLNGSVEIEEEQVGETDTYTLTLTFKTADDPPVTVTTAVDPVPQIRDIMVMGATPVDSDGDAITDLTTALDLKTTGTEGIYTLNYQIPAGTEAEFKMLPGYIDSTATKVGMATPPDPGPPTSEPDFEDQTIDDIVIWKGLKYDSRGPDMDNFLPLAHDAPGADLDYDFDPELPDGLAFREVDNQSRFIVGTPTMATTDADGDPGAAEYKYVVENGLTPPGMDEIVFNIHVKEPVKPDKPTAVMADEAARGVLTPHATANTVTVTWMAPSTDSEMAYGSKITGYKVHWTQVGMDGMALTGGTTGVSAVVKANTTETDAAHRYTTATLAKGIYQFEVVAINGVGDSAKSERTDDSKVIVADPPGKPTDLLASKFEDTVRLTWTEAEGADPNAPVTAHKVYITLAGNDEPVATEDAEETTYHLIETDLENGTLYAFRVKAVNIDGESLPSIGKEYSINVPSDTNRAPDFGDETIEDIVATAGTSIGVVILPEATDADGDTLTYSIDPALPTGLSFNENDLAITGTPSAMVNETLFKYNVSDGSKSATIRFTITVNAATAGPPPTSTVGTSLPANGFIVYVRDEDNPPHFGTLNPLIAEWSDMPNLEALFSEGGGGSLQLTVAGVSARQVVFSEIMWAVDEGKIGQDSYYGNQWIELRNRTANAISTDDITFAVKADGRPALPQSTDLVSNVVGGGSDWIKKGKGQNGNSGAADGSGQVEFRSMFRKRFHNDSAGWNGGEWLEATEVYHPNHKGTPGRAEPQGAKTFATSTVALGTVFNEISNSSTGAHEWIELRKRDGELSNLEKWVVHMVHGASDRDVASNPTQTKLFQMPKLNDGRYGDTLLITRTDPARDDSHPLRGGYNVEVADADQANEGRDSNIRYYVADDWTTDLPDHGNFVLILRHGNDKTNHEKIQDIAGYHPNLKVERSDFFSNLWPLINYPAPDIALNKIEVGKVHRRQKDNIAGTRTADKKDNADHVALRDVGWTGVGYKRNADASAKNGGTPGYPNNALQSNETEASGDPVIISEIMYATGDRGNIPQWIELRNTSQTVGVNLDGWRVTIVNHDQNSADATDAYPGDLVKSYGINGKIPPGQTFLIVAHSGTDNTNLPSERIVAIAARRGDRILSQYGFEITLETKGKDNKDANRKLADKVGNLAAGADARVRGNPQSYAEPAWMLPAGTNADGDRVSIVRADTDGLEAASWKSFDMSAHLNAPESTYYGNRNDLASPGYTVDSVLPVSLSRFRPERLKTGEVVVRWVTESETNNAGFNILRGEKLDGEFTKLNTKLIAGKGTTSEKTGYEFVDTSAKPNVVYYYQIQDVSLDGDVTALKTTHLRGNISVVGKLTTTWGELKLQD